MENFPVSVVMAGQLASWPALIYHSITAPSPDHIYLLYIVEK